MKRFKVISMHFCSDCNLSCPMCYKKKREGKQKPFSFFKELIPYVAELTDQCSIGGGEPFLHPGAIMALGRECKKNDMLMNVTTNGTQKMKKEYVKDVEMVSVSFDKYKRPMMKDLVEYCETIHELKKYTRVGVNLLIDKAMFDPMIFPRIVDTFFFAGAELIFALYPKNWDFIDIIPYTDIYAALTTMYKHFYIDDLTNMILREQQYSDWKAPCHYGKDIISINEFGEVTGCSFDGQDDAVLKLDRPEDILEIKKIKMQERHSCPYLKNSLRRETYGRGDHTGRRDIARGRENPETNRDILEIGEESSIQSERSNEAFE
jgi:MoaA/NifB/PqqE/SkfB family radical SAM enzyme